MLVALIVCVRGETFNDLLTGKSSFVTGDIKKQDKPNLSAKGKVKKP